MSRPSDEFEDAELREEFDWMYEFQSRMAERITNDPDVHNLVDYVRKIEDENARLRSCLSDDAENAKAIIGENKALRELVRDMMRFFEDGDYCTICEKVADCDKAQDVCDVDCLMRGVFRNRMKELGIEVYE